MNTGILSGLILATGLPGVAMSPRANSRPAPSVRRVAFTPASRRSAPGMVDILSFGIPASEKMHELSADLSDTISGGLGQPARRLLPRNPAAWEGGRMNFVMEVDPDVPNYFTARFWGDENTPNRLVLFCEGKQIGYRNEGDIDILDPGTEDRPYNGRFYYNTSPLPVEMTRGKHELHFEIRSSGGIWPYGTNFAQYQKVMTLPSRALYGVYTHTNGFFVPPPGEKQGSAPADPPVRQEPGPEVINQLKARVNREVSKQLNQDRPIIQPLMQFLARAYFVKWTPAYQNPKTVEQILKSLDSIFARYRGDPKLAQSDPATYNPDWFGLGPSGCTIALLAAPLRPYLDEEIADGVGGKITRRAAYTEMLVASRDWHRRHRRQYTNQSMINDLYGIYLSNRGVEVLDPARALPEDQVRYYLYESVGLQPWLGSDTDAGPDKPLGDNYRQLTDRGLTKELGYVGYYGEVIDWVTSIFDATRPTPGQPGDPKIKAQLIKIARARSIFRRPALDGEGNRAMRIETIIGWRDELHYPGDVAYGQRASWDASTIQAAAATLDPDLVAYAQQMFADNQFFASLSKQLKEPQVRETAGLLDAPEEYALLQEQPRQARRLPMSPDQPDFVFTDEEDGVVALKHGNEILYVSLYWRAKSGINFLARVHYITPRLDRIAVVRQDEQFEPSGAVDRRSDEVNTPNAPWIPHYPRELHSALTGEELPIPKYPPGAVFKPGQLSPYAGRADFYQLRYGPYLIGMNATRDKTFTLQTPAGFRQASELVSGTPAPLTGPIMVRPKSTVVLYVGR